jgi:hypothetical protein
LLFNFLHDRPVWSALPPTPRGSAVHGAAPRIPQALLPARKADWKIFSYPKARWFGTRR